MNDCFSLDNGLADDGTYVFKGVGNVVMNGLNDASASARSIVINKTSGAATQVTLTPSPDRGMWVLVKDGKGDAATNNITIVPAAGNIDGGANYVLSTNYAAVLLRYNGTQWNVVADSTGGASDSPIFNNVALTGLLTESAADALTAVGTSQGTALALTKEVNRITAGAATTGVTLPLASGGLDILVINSTSNTIHVYGAGTDTINDVATGTGILQAPNSIYLYACTTSAPAGKYYVEGVGGGYAGSLPTQLTAAAVTAHSGGTQALGFQLVAAYNRLSVVAAQGDSVLLPLAAVGLEVTIDNRGVAAAQVYGAGTDTINGIATATGVSHGVNQIATYYCQSAAPGGNWDVQFAQPQQAGIVSLTGTADVIPSHVAHTYVINKAGVDAMTLGAPTATTDDGLIIQISSNTANAHTLTATGLLECGTSAVNLATFAAQKGAGLTLMAYQGKWIVLASVGITFS